MKTQDQSKTEGGVAVASSAWLGILQPADSKRVADALIEKIEAADFDVALATQMAVVHSLRDGLTCGLGDAIVTVIEHQVWRAVESGIGSKEMGGIVANAIREGIEATTDLLKT